MNITTKIIYPEPVERVYQTMYHDGHYKGAHATKDGIYRIMLKAGLIDELGNAMASRFDVSEARTTVIHELKRICYMDNFYLYADPSTYDTHEINKHDIRKLVYYGVRYLGAHEYVFNPLTTEADFGYFEAVLSAIGALTPRELMQVFPIDKEYDGHKWECKDYYSTVEVLREFGMNRPIDEAEGQAFGFLWDYVNMDTRMFAVRFMSVLSDVSQLKGDGDPTVKFFERQGIEVKRSDNFD